MLRTSTVTRKGQVTIPVDIRRQLGIMEGDVVEFSLAEGQGALLTIRRGGAIAKTAGVFKSYAKGQPPRSAEELRRWAEELVAEGAALPEREK